MAHRVGYDAIAPVAKAMGLGQEFDLPGTAQRYGTIPDSDWKRRRFNQEWTASDSLNASIGQGYVSVSPLQLAVMTARIATGRAIQPRLLFDAAAPAAPALPWSPDFFAVAREGMNRVVNGNGTGGRARMDADLVRIAGKTGTAQVRGGGAGSGRGGAWKSRDHGLFVCFAPVEEPRYAVAIVVEHGMSSAAASPVAKDLLTFLYDRQRAMDSLTALEAGWGGTPGERLSRRYAAYQAAADGVTSVPVPPSDPLAEAAGR
jgi:penicillin-binding protein 2